MSTLYSIGQSNQLMDSLENAGFTPGDVTKLQQFKGLGKLRDVLAGTAKIVAIKHIIDCDVKPFVPDGWKVEEHIKGGQFKWDPSSIKLYLDESQENGKSIVGNKLRELLSGKPVFNANVLDYLYAHPELIPEDWKGKAIMFWGTIYRHSDGCLYVRCLYWNGDRWYWIYDSLDDDFDDYNLAALRK
jgi:hypothetical protein